jgi:peptidoglycan/xylan/chitin deacetylase (PgdA/CDA1 family)
VAITFDDGPDPVFTPRVLDLLRAHDAKATFFLTGTNASRHPEIVARIRQEGHLIGNHLLADEYILWKPESELERSLLETERHLGPFHGPKYIRPPRMLYGEAFLRVARQHGYTIVLGSAYVSDPYRPPSRLIAWSMRRMLTRGSILVLHDAGGDRINTIEALPAILQAGAERHLRFVTLQTLLAAAPGA